MFYQVGRTIPLYVPSASISLYKAATRWKEFTNIQAIAVNLTDANPSIPADTYGVGDLKYTRSLTSGNYATFCLPFDVKLSDYADNFSKVYVPLNFGLLRTSDRMLLLMMKEQDMASTTIEAGYPFLAKVKTTGSVVMSNSTEQVIPEALSNVDPVQIDIFDFDGKSGTLLNNTAIDVKIGGTYSRLASLDDEKYRAFSTEGWFGKVTAVPPFRMYVYKDDSQASARVADIVLSFEDGTVTDIQSLMEKSGSVDKNVYNLQGQKISSASAYKGIVIVNGKKVIAQ